MNKPEIVFSIAFIEEKLRQLSNLANKHSIDVLLSVKALPNKELIGQLASELTGFDVSNSNEFHITPSEAFHFVTNCPIEDLKFLKVKNNNKYLISCNSVYIWQEVRKQALPYVLRIDSSSLYAENLSISYFGLTLDQINEIQNELKKDPNFRGFHLHHGSQANTLDTYLRLIDQFNIFIKSFAPGRVLDLNLGGGFDNMSLNDIQSVFEVTRKNFQEHRIYFEPGRYYTEGAGKCFAQIIDLKIKSGNLVATLNVSRECHLKWSRIGKIHFLPSTSSPYSVSSSKIILRGNSCYENDLIAELSFPNGQKFSIGDEVIISNISGYSYSWNHSFNGIPSIPFRFE